MNGAQHAANDAAHPRIATWQRMALLAGIAASLLSAVGAFLAPQQFFRSYLLGYLFWLGIALGCLGIALLHQLTGGAWGNVIRRFLESGTRTLPLLALLFVPIVFGLPHLYEWTHPEVVAADHVLQHKSAYLNVPFLLGRAAFYFAVWIGFAMLLNAWSARGAAEPGGAIARRLKIASAPGILFYVLTMTFAAVDWVMSLDPHWFSTIFGVLFIVGQVLSAFAFVIALVARMRDAEPLASGVTSDHLHDLGNLLFAFLFLWAYISISQLLIIWSANLPEEIPWYLKRFNGGWEWVGYALVVFHFAVPFLILLNRRVKRAGRALAMTATAIIVMHFVDLFWIIVPEFHPDAFRIHWLDVAAPVAVGGLWLALFFRQLAQRPLLAAAPEPAPAGGSHARD
jgi:hypothetical protein